MIHLEVPDVDSSGNNNPVNKGSTNTIGKIGDAQSFDGIDDDIEIDTLNNFGQDLTQNFSLSFWIKTTTTGFHSIAGSLNDGFTTQVSITTGEGSVTGDVRIFIRDEGGNWIRIQTAGNLINTGSFVRVKFVKTGNTAQDLKAYINGAEATLSDVSNSGTFGATANLQYPMAIGARNLRGTFDQHIDADLDEFAIVRSAQTATYAETEYNNQNDVNTFWSVGAWNDPTSEAIVEVSAEGKGVAKVTSFWKASNYAVGATPSDAWTVDNGFTGYAIAEDAGGKKYMELLFPDSNRNFLRYLNVPDADEVEVYYQFKATSTSDIAIYSRGVNTTTVSTAFATRGQIQGSDLTAGEYNNGNYSTLGTPVNVGYDGTI